MLKPGLNKRQIQTKRDFYDKSLRKLLWWYTSGKLETAHKNVKKRLTAKLERVFYIRSYIFRDIFIFNNLKYLQQPVLVNKFIYNTLKKRRLFRLFPRLHVYSPTAVLHYWKFMMFYGNVNTFGLNWANTYISSLYRNLRKPRLYLKSLYGVQLYKFLLFSNHKFSPFFFTINHYLAYKKHLNTLSKIGGRAKAANIKYLSMPLADKIKRLHLLDNNAAVLYGYKFHFVGRFTRKQQSANLWFTKGSLATSAYSANIDYATYTVTLRYSACTIKV